MGALVGAPVLYLKNRECLAPMAPTLKRPLDHNSHSNTARKRSLFSDAKVVLGNKNHNWLKTERIWVNLLLTQMLCGIARKVKKYLPKLLQNAKSK